MKSLKPASCPDFAIPIPPHVKPLGAQLLRHKTTEALHAFLFALISQPSEALMEDQWQDPIRCFVGLIAMQEKAGFRKAHEITPYLAKVKYFIRLIAFAEAQRLKGLPTNSDSFLAIAKQVARQVLDCEPVNSFSSVSRLDTYASSIAFNAPRDAKAQWNRDFTRLSLGGMIISMSIFQAGNRKAIKDIGARIDEITQGHAFNYSIPEDFEDDMNNREFGYGLVDNAKHVPKDALLRAILSDPESGFLTNDGTTLNIPKAHAFLQEANEIAMELALSMHTTSGLPQRGTEISDLRIRNHERQRTFFFILGEMLAVFHYNKTTNNTGMDKNIPHQLHRSLADLLIRYLLIVRPMEVHLAQRLYKPEVAALYSEFFLLNKDTKVTSTQFGAALTKFTGTYYEVELGLNDYRHFAVATCREYIHPAYNPHSDDDEDDIGDLQAGHTSAVARHHYARLIDSADWQTTSVLRSFCEHSRKWHTVCGLGGGQAIPVFFVNRLTYTGSTSSMENPFQDRPVPAQVTLPSNVPEEVPSGVDANLLKSLVEVVNSLRKDLADDRAALPGKIKTAVYEGILACNKEKQVPVVPQPAPAPIPRASSPLPAPHPRRPVPIPVLDEEEEAPPFLDDDDDGVNPMDEVVDQNVPLPSSTTLTRVKSPSQITTHMEEMMLANLRLAYNNPTLDWKSAGQQCLVVSSLLTDYNVVGCIPTGGGKSASFEVPAATIEKNRMTLVVVPFRALMKQFTATCKRLNISVLEWTGYSHNVQPPPSVMLVSPERCNRQELFLYVKHSVLFQCSVLIIII